jgi:hypothetical protein
MESFPTCSNKNKNAGYTREVYKTPAEPGTHQKEERSLFLSRWRKPPDKG